MSAAKTTGFWSETDKKRWLNQAVIRACNFAPWSFLSHHSSQLTEKDRDAYFTPFDYKPGSFIYVSIGGKEHTKVSIQNLKSGNHIWDRVFALVGDQYIVKPVPEKDGLVIDVYYRRRPIKMTEPTDVPITPEEMDEPIVKLALGTCLKKEPNRRKDADQEIAEAIGMLQELKNREDEEAGDAGFQGQAQSTRFLYRNSNRDKA